MSEMNLQELIDRLEQKDGVEGINLDITVSVRVKQVNTGETTEMHQPIRERVIDESELSNIVDDSDWEYYGDVDMISDYLLEDKYSITKTVKD